MIGQVRGFSLDEFLSDYEPAGEALPWAVGDDGWVKEKKPKVSPTATIWFDAAAARGDGGEGGIRYDSRSLSEVMSAEGVSPSVKVLYVPHYVPLQHRLLVMSKLYTELSQLLPRNPSCLGRRTI